MKGDVWKVIRAEYARRWDVVRPRGGKAKAHGAKQEAVARQGGLAGQNAISRILNNKNNGPTVEIFVRGLIGMGVKPSEFFLAIEQQLPIPIVPPAWSRAANVPPTSGPSSVAADAADAERARFLKAGQYVQRLLDLFVVRDVPRKKSR